eukprot:4797852-Pyramimonas_sp.AAC.1
MGTPPMGSFGSSRRGCAIMACLQGASWISAREGLPLGDLAARPSPSLLSSDAGQWRPLPLAARLRA